ncbi:MAG: flippase [Clostridia bacterium]|nr:flippase [Clostridia bacterium]
MSVKKTSTRINTLYNVSYRVFSILLPLVTAPYLSRTVGQTGVGMYAHAWNASYIFVLIGTLGLESYGVRAISRVRDNPSMLSRTFSEIFGMQRLVAAVALFFWLIYCAFFSGETSPIAWSLTLMSVSCLCNLDWCLMGLDQFRPIALRNTFVKLLAAGCVFLFIHSQEDLWIYGFAWSLSTLLGCLLCCMSLRKLVTPVRVPLRDSLRHFVPCLGLFVSVIAVSIYRTMDKVMVGSIAGMAQNGLYENAEKIIYCLSGFISAFGNVMMPRSAHLIEQGDLQEVRRSMHLSMHLILCMVSAMAFGILSVADRFAPLFYGDDFVYSGTLMMPLGFSLIMIGFANVVRMQWILPNGLDRVVLHSVLTGACVNLIVNFSLIPSMGAMGAVVGTLLAELAVPVVQYLHVRGDLPYRSYLKILLSYLLIGTSMTLAVRSLMPLVPDTWTGLMLLVFFGGAVYGILTLCYWKIAKVQILRMLLHRKRRASPAVQDCD